MTLTYLLFFIVSAPILGTSFIYFKRKNNPEEDTSFFSMLCVYLFLLIATSLIIFSNYFFTKQEQEKLFKCTLNGGIFSKEKNQCIKKSAYEAYHSPKSIIEITN